MPRTADKRRAKRKLDVHNAETIVIDAEKKLIFYSEEELYDHFLPQIQTLEKEFFSTRSASDFQDDELTDYEELLSQVLDDPDEIWKNLDHTKGLQVNHYIAHFSVDGESVYYIALVYVTGETPSFVFLHFPTRDIKLVEKYRRGDLIYDRVMKEVGKGAIEGDALGEGDDLAVGLYKAMLKVRSEKDVPEENFQDYGKYRESTIEEADEIWRTNDLDGNVLVSFIKDCTEDEPDLHYISITIEDGTSSSHALLFSFPTKDSNLVDRYRHGENLQAEEVVQEASH